MAGTGGNRGGCLYWVLGLLLVLGLGGGLLFLFLEDDTGGPRGDRVTNQAPSPTPPQESPAPPPEPARLALPEEAGGLTLTFSGGGEVPARQAAMERAGIAVTELVGGRYEDGDVLVTFHGGALATPLTPEQVDDAGRELLETTFAANFANLTPAETTGYDAGPLGGQVWCTSYDDPASHACGWIDEGTIGFVFRIGTAQADTAALLLDMRADIVAG